MSGVSRGGVCKKSDKVDFRNSAWIYWSLRHGFALIIWKGLKAPEKYTTTCQMFFLNIQVSFPMGNIQFCLQSHKAVEYPLTFYIAAYIMHKLQTFSYQELWHLNVGHLNSCYSRAKSQDPQSSLVLLSCSTFTEPRFCFWSKEFHCSLYQPLCFSDCCQKPVLDGPPSWNTSYSSFPICLPRATLFLT